MRSSLPACESGNPVAPTRTAQMMRDFHAACKLWVPGPESDEEDMTRRMGPRTWATATMTTALILAFSGMALADIPRSVPNNGASHNCVALTSGILYFEKNEIRLGRDVSMFAPHGGQRDYVQGALQKNPLTEPCFPN